MKEVTLHADDLETLLALINELNPANQPKLGAGSVTIRVDNSSGIGSIVTATIPMTCGNYHGEFTTEISGVDDW
jgi:hypothetical protein